MTLDFLLLSALEPLILLGFSYPVEELWVVGSRANHSADINYFKIFKERLGRDHPHLKRGEGPT